MAKELAEANTLVFSLDTENLGESLKANKAMLGEYALKKISRVSGGKYFAHIDNYEKRKKSAITRSRFFPRESMNAG